MMDWPGIPSSLLFPLLRPSLPNSAPAFPPWLVYCLMPDYTHTHTQIYWRDSSSSSPPSFLPASTSSRGWRQKSPAIVGATKMKKKPSERTSVDVATLSLSASAGTRSTRWISFVLYRATDYWLSAKCRRRRPMYIIRQTGASFFFFLNKLISGTLWNESVSS